MTNPMTNEERFDRLEAAVAKMCALLACNAHEIDAKALDDVATEVLSDPDEPKLDGEDAAFGQWAKDEALSPERRGNLRPTFIAAYNRGKNDGLELAASTIGPGRGYLTSDILDLKEPINGS